MKLSFTDHKNLSFIAFYVLNYENVLRNTTGVRFPYNGINYLYYCV